VAYCTQDDILDQVAEAELVRLTDDASAGTVDADVVAAAIAGAEAEIDSYVGRRHTVPLSPVPPVVRDRAVDIAVYRLYKRRRKANDDVRKSYEDALAWLKDVAKGLVSLGVDDPDATPSPTHRPSIDGPDRIFDRDKLEGF